MDGDTKETGRMMLDQSIDNGCLSIIALQVRVTNSA